MKPQSEINADWTREMQSNVGPITMLVPPTRVSNLRKPYQYTLPVAGARAMLAEIKEALRPFEALLQHDMCKNTPTKYGCHLTIFLLGYRPNHTGEGGGLTSEQWEVCTREVGAALWRSLGNDVPLYVEPWTDQRKFQARFETYILYAELA